MADKLANLKAEIAKLEKEANEIEAKERKTAIQEIKALIKKYDIGADDLGLGEKGAKPKRKAGVKAKTKKRATRKPAKVKYQTDDGQTWTGRGRKPGWVVQVIEEKGEEGLEAYRAY